MKERQELIEVLEKMSALLNNLDEVSQGMVASSVALAKAAHNAAVGAGDAIERFKRETETFP